MQGGTGYPLAPQRAGPRVVRPMGVPETSLHGGIQLKMFPPALGSSSAFNLRKMKDI